MTNRRGGFGSLLVEPYKQVKLGVIIILLNLLFSVLIMGTFGYYVYDIFSIVSSYFKLSAADSLITWEKFRLPLITGSFLLVTFILLTLYISIKYTHQIYGPLVSIHRFIDDLLASRKPEAIQLRESDQLQELAIKLNELAERTLHAPITPTSVSKINTYLDEVLAHKVPLKLNLPKEDPLFELSEKIKLLVKD